MQDYFDLNQPVYDWCVRLFERGKKLLGVRILLHHNEGQIDAGDIFLFNHFARAETFIPQYCIYEATGALCRSVAAAEFFRGNERLAGLLRDVGAVPNDHPELLSLLAIDILKGRKIVIFPEGGMVKDRQVIDANGDYSVYSRSARARRKHHSGAARLAVGLQVFKQAVLHRLESGRPADVEHWAEALGLPSTQLLIERARRPVTVVPANITFYPLRVDDAVLFRLADLYRAIRPTFVLTHSLKDPYNFDHPLATHLAQEARVVAQAHGYRPDVPVLGAPPVYLFEPHQPEQCDWKPEVLLDITPVWDKKRRAIECMEGQEHLWEYYTRVALQRGVQAARNSDLAITYGEGYMRVFPHVTRSLG
jgi:4-oxalomesaconate hydratase